VGDLLASGIHLAIPLSWLALGLTAGALLPCFWDPEAPGWGLPAGPLYALGVVAIGLVLPGKSLQPRRLVRSAAPLLGGYVLGVIVLVRTMRRWLRRFQLPPQVESRLAGWFLPAQAVIGGSVLVLGLWICLDFPTLEERLAGPLAAALVLAACWL